MSQFPSEIFGQEFSESPVDSKVESACSEVQKYFRKISRNQTTSTEGKIIEAQGNSSINIALKNICKSDQQSMKSAVTTRMSLRQHQAISLNFPPMKKITEKDKFSCPACLEQGKNLNCQLCFGTKEVTGDQNMIKFMEHILEFKLGKIGSYQDKGQKQDLNKQKLLAKENRFDGKNPEAFLNNLIQKNQKKSSIHIGYSCDLCKIDPIQGNRHHCQDEECEGNFDLCEKCFNQNVHTHKMQKICENGFKNLAVSLSMTINQKISDKSSLKMG